MNNFNHAVGATNKALESQGSAMRENDAYMESIQAKLSQLKSTFQDFANNVISSDLTKAVLDLANGLLKIANTDLGQIVTQIVLLTGLGWGATSLTKALGIFRIGAAQFATFIPILKNIGLAATGAAGSVTAVGTGLTSLASVALPVAGIIAGIAVAGYNIYKAWKEANPTLEEAETQLSNLQTQLQSNKDKLEEINGLSWNEKTPEILAEKDALELQNAELERNIELTKKQREKAAVKGAGQTQEVYRETRYRTFGQDMTWGSVEEATKAINKIYGEGSKWADFLISKLEAFNVTVEASGDTLNNSLINILKDAVGDLNEFGSVTDENNDILQNNLSVIQEQAEYYTTLKDLGYTLSDSQQALVDVFNEYNIASENAVSHTDWLNNNLVTNATSIEELKNKYPQLSSAISENNGVIGINVQKLNEQSYASSGAKQAVIDLVAQLTIFNNTDLDVSQKLAALVQLARTAGSTSSLLAALGPDGKIDPRAGSAIVSAYGSIENYWKKVLGTISIETETPFPDTDFGTGKSTGTTSKKLTDAALEKFKSYYKDLQHLRDMDKIDEETYFNRLRILVDNYTKDATAHMKEYGLNVNQINQNMYQYEEEIYKGRAKLAEDFTAKVKKSAENQKTAFEQQKSDYETAASYVVKKIEEEISKLEQQKSDIEKFYDDQIKALQDTNDELERQIQYEQLLNNLAQAKDKRLYVFSNGQFQYVQDTEAVTSAQAELDAYEREETLRKETENLNKLKEQAINAIEEQIDYWEDYKEQWSNVVDEYENEQNRLIAEQILGTDFEQKNWEKRLKNLKDFAQEYNSILSSIQSLEQQIEDIDSGKISKEELKGLQYNFDNAIKVSSTGSWTEAEMREGFPDYPSFASTSNKNDIVSSVIKAGSNIIFGGNKSLKKYARGTDNASQGLSIVGENGPELRVLNQGEGIIPTDITRNLWNWGKINPSAIASNINNTFNIDNLTLPNAKDAQTLITGLKQMAYQRAYKRA